MLCSESSMVNTGWDGIQAVSLRCRSWGCPLCCESRRAQLIALARSGKPTTFITLTVNPAFGSSQYDRARRLADAWRTIVRRAKAKYGYKTIPYLCVFEATKKGEPHLHILARVEWISQKWMSKQMDELMKAPVVDIREVKDPKTIAFYITKYCGKEPHRFDSCKRYWSTRDWELTPFEKTAPEGRWDHQWTLVRTPLSDVAAGWRLQGLEVEESRHRVIARWRGPPDDEIAEVQYIERRRRKDLPW